MTYGEEHDPESADLREELKRLAACIYVLQQKRDEDAQTIQGLLEAHSMENTLSQGLESIRVQLEPLRDLTPQRRTLLEPDGAAKLFGLLRELKRPTWYEDPMYDEVSWTSAVGRRKL